MARRVLIVGGGAAGWLTAAYLARRFITHAPNGLDIRLIESPEVGILGVGEGTFPSIRKTLRRIGADEAAFVRECNATFKQGVKFVNWRREPAPASGADEYLHPFQIAEQPDKLDLLPYWLLGAAGESDWAEVATVQKRVADARRAPKTIAHGDFAAPLSYAYHFDAVRFAHYVRRLACDMGVRHMTGTVDAVRLDETGAIAALETREQGELTADLYIDCTGFRAQLIGEALGVPFQSCRDVLFCDRAVAIQAPYESTDQPIQSYTVSTAQDAGWIWDIGLSERRGVGYVYSSAHCNADRAEAVLRAYIGPAAASLPARAFAFEPGYRETSWRKNCVAIGLSSGFLEPLEATGIGFIEIAALILANLFPFGDDFETGARQFNEIMRKRYQGVMDFLKLHYCLSGRRDSGFWRDNVDAASVPLTLTEKLDRWRFRPPDFMDVDLNHDVFTDANWQYVLYGMGFKTDLTPMAGVLKYFNEAEARFAALARQGERALAMLPAHRDLIRDLQSRGFAQAQAPSRGRIHV
jgi:flavin-dependent dehydrogenase